MGTGLATAPPWRAGFPSPPHGRGHDILFSSDFRRVAMKKETQLGVSWAICLAGVVAGAAAVHAWFSRFGVPQMHRAASSEEISTINRVIVTCPRPSVVVLGNSRARESVICPMLARDMGLTDGEVRNYDSSGANAETTCALVRLMALKRKCPPVVVWPVSPRELTWTGSPPSYFAPLSQPTKNTVSTSRGIGIWLSCAVSRNLRVSWLRDLMLKPQTAVPSLGDKTYWQMLNEKHLREGRERSFKRASVSAADIARTMTDLEMGKRSTLDSNGCAYAEQALADLRSARCRVILAEVPVSIPFRNAYPPRVYDAFLDFFRRVSKEHGATFLELPTGRDSFTDADVADVTHCNWTGATRFTQRLIPLVREAVSAPPAPQSASP